MSRTTTVFVNTDVKIDLAEIDGDALVEEVQRRNVPCPIKLHTEYELVIIRQRFFQERRRQATHGGLVTQAEKDFWWHTYGLDV